MRKLLTSKTLLILALGIFILSIFLFVNKSSEGCIAGTDCTQSIKPESLWEPISQQFITSISPY